MGSTTSAIFNGTSRFSQDFQNLISRATAIASLPITQLNSDKTKLSDQSTALTALENKFSSLHASVDSIEKALGGSSLQATISDPNKVSVTFGEGATEGTYSIDVVDAGAYATSMTARAWVSEGSHTYQITLDGITNLDLTTMDNTVGSVASAINAQYSDKVRATVVNVGSGEAPDYRISLQSVQLGDLHPDILDNGASLKGTVTGGAVAKYIVNNSGITVQSTSRAVPISTGVTVNLLAKDNGTPVNITVARSTSALSDALYAFTTAYNSAVDELNKQHGNAGGALSGQRVINDLSQTLSGLSTYNAPAGQISGLADLGVDLDKTGHLTLNPFTLLGSVMANSSGVSAFLGSSKAGGFLKWASDSLAGVQDTTAGILPAAESSVQSQITNITNQITTQQDRVDQLRIRLQEQMAAADALIASIEQQYSNITDLFQAMDTASKQYK